MEERLPQGGLFLPEDQGRLSRKGAMNQKMATSRVAIVGTLVTVAGEGVKKS